MRKLQKAISLALALAMCLCLTVSASAAGTKKEVVDETHGVKITLNGFLREETHYYNCMIMYDEDTGVLSGGTRKHTIYVVADNSTVTVEALPGRKYADPKFVEAMKNYSRFNSGLLFNSPEYEIYKTAFGNDIESYAYMSTYNYDWDPENECFYDAGGPAWPLEKAETHTVSPSEEEYLTLSGDYEISWMCESDYARLVPATLKTSDWAEAEVKRAFDADLTPFSPYISDCTRGMNRGEFAATIVNLYAAMTGQTYYDLDVDTEHPFSDVNWETTPFEDEIGMAYNLGLVKGAGGSLFNPRGTLTRQEAAVMLARVYIKVHGQIPQVANTTFADDKDVGSWAKSEATFMADKEIVKGVGGNRFAPAGTLTVQEAVIMANRMLEKLK